VNLQARHLNNKPVRKAVIAAAGFGTRFLPQTKAMPKEMLPVVDKPIIQYIVEELVAATSEASRTISII
jgi:UTP--glucose-1-phosphate uridylyltransferase